MIDKSLFFLKNTINQHLINQYGLDEDILVLNHLVDSDGSVPHKNQNKIVLTLINLEHESNTQFNSSERTLLSSSIVNIEPEVRFNIDLLFTANFDDYQESLKFLSSTIAFFQAHSSMDQTEYPNIPVGLESLRFNIVNSSYSETHNLWSAMGAKYQPSIIYRAKSIAIKKEQTVSIEIAVNDGASKRLLKF